MFSPWGALIGAGVGAAKNEFIDRPREKEDRKAAAETIRLSPWTKMSASDAANSVRKADLNSAMFEGASMGMGMGQGIDAMGGASALTGEADTAMEGADPTSVSDGQGLGSDMNGSYNLGEQMPSWMGGPKKPAPALPGVIQTAPEDQLGGGIGVLGSNSQRSYRG